jgi:formylglycine-generating enzyme required for sulfatase activity
VAAGNSLGRVGDPRFEGDYLEPELVIIPKSKFWMGSESKVAYEDEQPMHPVHVRDFQMAKYPVTNAQFKRFVDAGGYHREECWTKAGWAWQQEKPEERRWPQGWEDGRFPTERANHPVVGITWHEALAYTRWLAEVTGRPYRLPTEAEWEKAARGDRDRREYPWGDVFDSSKTNLKVGDERVGNTSPVGIYPGGASPYGIMDMSGNVWEWCSSLHHDYPYACDDDREDLEAEGQRVLRGGSWSIDSEWDARCASRYGVLPTLSHDHVGLRVVVGATALSPGSGFL